MTAQPKPFVFLLLPNYSLLGLSAAVEVLRVANRMAGATLYSWQMMSYEGGLFSSSGDIKLDTSPMGEITPQISKFVICGGDGSENLTDAKTVSFVRKQARYAEMSGAISDGSYLAAHAGLFDGYRSTIHWQCHDGYVEKNPTLEVTRKIYEIDRDRFSCAGGVAAFDLFLKLVEQDHGRNLSLSIAENAVVGDMRPQESGQRLNPSFKFAANNPHLGRVMEAMEQHLENPISVKTLAGNEGITLRQLGRLFNQHTGETPSQFYMGLRVRRAAYLLRQTGMSVEEISVACGFASSSHLAKNFQRTWGVNPRDYRTK